jgi:putative phosphoserine phosphatase/1-acylglycerol-3-phosphate O-acyltransferase
MKRMIARRMQRKVSAGVNADFHHYLEALAGSEHREDVVAFFDLDRTIIAGYSITALAIEQIRSGAISLRHLLSQISLFVDYGLGRAGYEDLLRATVAGLVGFREQDLIDLGERAYRRRLHGSIYGEARQLVDTHKDRGHEVVMVTSATRYQALPIAKDLGVDELCCTELEISNGLVTGNVIPCHGMSKRSAAIRLGTRLKADLSDAYFYTDSTEDLPLLEAVGRPVTANARADLSELATARGWPQLAFGNRGDSRTPMTA